MTISIDVYVPPRNRNGKQCTCAGPTVGFPQHEPWCGTPEEREERGVFCCGWADGVCTGCPNRAKAA